MIIHGDSLEVLKTLDANSVDAVVTDPPAGIAFMNKSWDSDKGGRDEWIKWLSEIMRECYRVMKPGAHGFVWAIPRTSHWTGMALEDAGFRIKDSVCHIFGSGFPKSKSCKDIGRPELGSALKPAAEYWWLIQKPISEKNISANVLRWGTGALNVDASRIGTDDKLQGGGSPLMRFDGQNDRPCWGEGYERMPTQGNAQGRWPANVLFDEEAAALLDEQSGVLKNGGQNKTSPDVQGALFGNRKSGNTKYAGDSGGASRFFYVAKASKSERSKGLDKHEMFKVETGQCKDANTAAVQLLQRVISESTAKWLIGESGANITAIFPKECKSTIATAISKIIESKILNSLILSLTSASIPDASELMENGSSHAANVENLRAWLLNITSGETELALGASRAASSTLQSISENAEPKDFNNFHSTVKPIKLMEYLVRMICPPGGLCLDPFAGSGSTGVAAKRLNFKFIGIERESEYCEIARKRLESA